MSAPEIESKYERRKKNTEETVTMYEHFISIDNRGEQPETVEVRCNIPVAKDPDFSAELMQSRRNVHYDNATGAVTIMLNDVLGKVTVSVVWSEDHPKGKEVRYTYGDVIDFRPPFDSST